MAHNVCDKHDQGKSTTYKKARTRVAVAKEAKVPERKMKVVKKIDKDAPELVAEVIAVRAKHPARRLPGASQRMEKRLV